MRIKMTDTLATTTGSLLAGSEYDIDDAEGKRLVEGGLAAEVDASTGRTKPGKPPKRPERQTMDRATGTPAEDVEPRGTAFTGGRTVTATNPTLPSQTAAGVEAQAAREKDTRNPVNAPATVVNRAAEAERKADAPKAAAPKTTRK